MFQRPAFHNRDDERPSALSPGWVFDIKGGRLLLRNHPCMGRRGKQRIKMVLPVKLWGRDAKGKPFFQLAHTLDINRGGARVGGLRWMLNFDDAVELQYRHKKARFRVGWVGRPGTPMENQIGVKYLEPEKDIWGLDLPEDSLPDQFQAGEPARGARKATEPAPKEKELRLHERFPCTGGVEVRTSEKAEVGTWTILDDISLGGCYVNTPSPLAVDARPNLLVRAGNVEIRTWAAVTTSHPGVGMALEFTDMSAADQRRLDALIKALAGGRAEAAPDPSREVAARIKSATRDLREIDERLKSVNLDPRVLREFRIALGHTRHTAWAIQQWVELEGKHADPFPVVVYLNSERIRIATFLCQNLAAEIGAMEVHRKTAHFENLLHAVEDLFQRLAGFRFALEDKAVETPPAAAAKSPAVAEGAQAEGSGEVAPPAPSAAAQAAEAAASEAERRAKKDRRRLKKADHSPSGQERRAKKDRRGSKSAGAA